MPARDATRFQRHWKSRVRAPKFARELTALVAEEIRAAARAKVKDVVDVKRVRRLLEQADLAAFDDGVLTDLVIEAGRTVRARLRAKKQSARELFGAELSASVDALLEEPVVLSRRAESLIGRLMQTELVRDLFTDIIHTSIVSFNKRLNPLFGGVTMTALEPRIKGFIRLFMPMIQQQATAFVVDKDNREGFADFTASILRELLNQPLSNLLALGSVAGRSRARPLVRNGLRSATWQALHRELAIAVWEKLFARLRDKTLGDVIALDEYAEPIAAEIVATLRAALLRPRVVEFLEREAALAATAARA
jgi:hypothetical protein